MPELILASTSIYRQKLLQRLGHPFRSQAPDLDEEQEKIALFGRPHQEITEQLALKKAQSICEPINRSIIIAGDQAMSFSGQFLGKPKSREQNIKILKELSNKSHQLITSVVLLAPDRRPIIFTETVHFQLRNLSNDEICTYVDADKPWDCAGGYRFESGGIRLFSEVKCNDPTAIEGLPLIALNAHLNKLLTPPENAV